MEEDGSAVPYELLFPSGGNYRRYSASGRVADPPPTGSAWTLPQSPALTLVAAGSSPTKEDRFLLHTPQPPPTPTPQPPRWSLQLLAGLPRMQKSHKSSPAPALPPHHLFRIFFFLMSSGNSPPLEGAPVVWKKKKPSHVKPLRSGSR